MTEHGVQWSHVNTTTRSSGISAFSIPTASSILLTTSAFAFASPSCPAMSPALMFIRTKSYSCRALRALSIFRMRSEFRLPSHPPGRG